MPTTHTVLTRGHFKREEAPLSEYDTGHANIFRPLVLSKASVLDRRNVAM